MRRKSGRRRPWRLLGIGAVVAALMFGGVVPAGAIDSRITNQAIYAEANSYTTGQGVGNCKQWVSAVINAVATDAGSPLRVGPGMYSGFTDAGGVLVPAANATQGDMIFVYNPSAPETFFYGMHAAFIVEVLGNNTYNVIDANYSMDGRIQRHTWNLNEYLDGFPNLEAVVFRFGTVDSAAGMTSVYRFYNVRNGSHFYTPSEQERDMVIAKWPTIYKFEGVAYTLNPANNTQPLHRFYNKLTGSHFYTVSSAERDMVVAKWPSVFTYEGETYNVNEISVPNSIPVYRFFNVTNGSHFYTASDVEREAVIAKWPNVYKFEGVGFYLGQ